MPKKKQTRKRHLIPKHEDYRALPGNRPLSNVKHEAFCHAYVAFGVKSRAYQEVYGCEESTAGVEGHRLLTQPKIVARCGYLFRKAIASQEPDQKIVKSWIARVAQADITNYIRWDEDGNVQYIDSRLIDGTALSEVNIEVTKGRRRVKIKLLDKMKALEVLAKITKLFSDAPTTNIYQEQAEEADRAYKMRVKMLEEKKKHPEMSDEQFANEFYQSMLNGSKIKPKGIKK